MVVVALVGLRTLLNKPSTDPKQPSSQRRKIREMEQNQTINRSFTILELLNQNWVGEASKLAKNVIT